MAERVKTTVTYKTDFGDETKSLIELDQDYQLLNKIENNIEKSSTIITRFKRNLRTKEFQLYSMNDYTYAGVFSRMEDKYEINLDFVLGSVIFQISYGKNSGEKSAKRDLSELESKISEIIEK